MSRYHNYKYSKGAWLFARALHSLSFSPPPLLRALHPSLYMRSVLTVLPPPPHTHTQELQNRENLLKNRELLLRKQELLLAEQLQRQGRAKQELDKEREEMKREKSLLQERYEVTKQLSMPKDQPDGPKQPVIPPRLHKFSFSRLLSSLKGSNRDQSNEGPLPSKLETPGLPGPKSTRRLNSSPGNSGGGSFKFKRSSLTMSLSRLEGNKRTPLPDKGKSLPTRGHKRHGSDDFNYRG